MPRSDAGAQAEARREADRKAKGCKPWHPGGPGRPPKDVLTTPSGMPKKRTTRAVSPAPKPLSFSDAVVRLEARRAELGEEISRIDTAIAAVKALL